MENRAVETKRSRVWQHARLSILRFLTFSGSLSLSLCPSVISSNSAFSSPGIWPHVRLFSHGWKPEVTYWIHGHLRGLTAITDFSTVQVHQCSHSGGSSLMALCYRLIMQGPFTGTPIRPSSIFQLEPRLCVFTFIIRVVGTDNCLLLQKL